MQSSAIPKNAVTVELRKVREVETDPATNKISAILGYNCTGEPVVLINTPGANSSVKKLFASVQRMFTEERNFSTSAACYRLIQRINRDIRWACRPISVSVRRSNVDALRVNPLYANHLNTHN